MLIYHGKPLAPPRKAPPMRVQPVQPSRGVTRRAPPMMRAAPRKQMSGLGDGLVSGAASGASAGSALGPVGTAVGAAAGALMSLLSKPPTRQKQTFAAFKQSTGPMQGREIDINTILDGIYYPFKMESHGIYRVRKQFKELGAFVTALAAQVAQAALSGQISNADDAQSVYTKIIAPWFWPIAGKVTADVTNTMPRLLTALVDHYLYDQPMVGTIAKYGSTPITKLSDVLQRPAAVPAPAVSTAPTMTTGAGLPATVPIATAQTQLPMATQTPAPMTTQTATVAAPEGSGISPGVLIAGGLLLLKMLS